MPATSVTGIGQGEEAAGLHSRGYVTLLLTSGLLGVPLSLVAFGFLVVVHELEHVVWHDLPSSLGHAVPPPWWPVVTIGAAGVLVALAVTHLPGRGGHVPVAGLGAGATAPAHLPGVVLAAAASLVGGAVVGPEAPLIAIGSGLALLAVRRTPIGADPTTSTIVAAAGSAAAISAIFGNPLVAAVIFLEVLGLARRQLMLVVLPCLFSSGVGALLFTGLGRWTGFEVGALALPGLAPTRLVPADVVWAVPLAGAVAVGTWLVYSAGRAGARLAEVHTTAATIGAGLLAGTAACAYALITDRSPGEVALSGQATLPALVSDPGWSTGALVALLVCKAVAYAACLGTFRGGPVFPALVLGAAVGVLAAGSLPGLALLPALAIGMAAGMAVTGLPVTSVVLVVLLLGDAATSLMPVVILAVVVALVVEEMLSSRRRLAPLRPGHHHQPGGAPS
ncbi:Putative ion-transport protein YfeO [Nocardioides aquaticus]|uniref:Ion-transport protein YfeO n=1 Tax=Nocardioides aquaticus TaxID=160826 RepID=A0ABX8EC59_9ACTN|nr:chloride channel protein [Nocardioides aquaticus]QVT77824.1 Putative ion-transport protein YfeO [Nocardioides aquaticus]